MNVNIQSVHFDADQKLLSFISEKIGKLKTFHDAIIGTKVILKLDKSSSTDNKVAEIELHIPGKDLFAKRQCTTFEEAADTAVNALKSQLKKRKEKIKGL
jgi:putative sigma-54 modulation protein